MPDHALHRNVDKIVLGAAAAHPDRIKTAIVCPPTIFGIGRGTGNKRSVQVNLAIKTFIEQNGAFSVGKGENVWHEVYVRDLSNLYLLLGNAAANGGEPAAWDDQGYYFAENGSFVWGDIFQAIANEAHKQGLLDSTELTNKTIDEVNKYEEIYGYRLGTTSRGISKRARKLLGWTPVGPSLLENLPELVRSEAELLNRL